MEKLKKNNFNRVVILGGGFIGSSLKKTLDRNSIKNILITRKNVDFRDKKKTHAYLELKVKKSDTIFFVASVAPVKTVEMFISNLKIIESICDFFKNFNVYHFINVSSDAVYFDSQQKINENFRREPDSLHGLMHLLRENYLSSSLSIPITNIRPTLIFGYEDPHNGYGPNSFFRKILRNENISLFGNGEELRDHVYIDDVINIIIILIKRKILGTFNIVTGEIISFYDIATIIRKSLKKDIEINKTKRVGIVPHNGYRALGNELLLSKIGEYKFTNIELGIKKMYKKFKLEKD